MVKHNNYFGDHYWYRDKDNQTIPSKHKTSVQHMYNVGRRLRRWPNTAQMPHKCLVFAGYSYLKIIFRLRFKVEFRVLAVNFTIFLLLIIKHNFASKNIS